MVSLEVKQKGSLWKYNNLYNRKKKLDLVSWNLTWVITMKSLAS